MVEEVLAWRDAGSRRLPPGHFLKADDIGLVSGDLIGDGFSSGGEVGGLCRPVDPSHGRQEGGRIRRDHGRGE